MPRRDKFLLLTALYLAQGLPFGFFTQALPVLMREQGLSLKAISATSLLFLPWALKFLWAPLVDRLGTRRQWILAMQGLSVAGALLLCFSQPERSIWIVFAALLLFNLFAAVQDVATDGLAVRLLDAHERGGGNGVQVGAYRIGMILGGGLLLWVFARAGWQAMFLGMAGLLALTSLPVLRLRENGAAASHPSPPPRVLLLEWAARLRVPGMLGFLALIGAYKFGDSMASAMVGPMLRDHGFSKEAIALLKGTLGSAAALAGAALGGALAWRAGRRAALLACGLLQTLSIGMYVAGVEGVGGLVMLQAACIAEHLLGGMATVALFTLMMDACDPEHAGTDYTVQACAIVMVMGLANVAAGVVGDAYGYGVMFGTSFVLSGLGCLLLVRALDRGAGPARLALVWRRPGAQQAQ
jgi:MFS family permease